MEGDAGDEVGYKMEGGKIRIRGDIEGLSDNIYGGSIYIWYDEKGEYKPIVENGKRLV